ncbi:hypothetical protein ABS755_13010 [Castellaniella sp. FW104-16D08]|uniref:hypothetical protein n=1 Tax=unclassified Castellaniella TaxID=2617606 RepID=UPI00331544B0
MKKTKFLIGVCLSLSVTVAASAQTSPRVVTCDTTVAPQALLQVQDEASSKGAVVQNATLVTLASGMKAVQFSVRNARNPNPFNTILKVHYTIHWSDDCGRLITTGAQVSDGLMLDANRQEIVQSVAMDLYATHAMLRITVEN